MVKVSDEPIGYAEEAERFIVHFSKDGKPVLLEILDAKNFIVESFNVLFKAMQSEGVVVVADGENKSGAPEGDVCADRLSEGNYIVMHILAMAEPKPQSFSKRHSPRFFGGIRSTISAISSGLASMRSGDGLVTGLPRGLLGLGSVSIVNQLPHIR